MFRVCLTPIKKKKKNNTLEIKDLLEQGEVTSHFCPKGLGEEVPNQVTPSRLSPVPVCPALEPQTVNLQEPWAKLPLPRTRLRAGCGCRLDPWQGSLPQPRPCPWVHVLEPPACGLGGAGALEGLGLPAPAPAPALERAPGNWPDLAHQPPRSPRSARSPGSGSRSPAGGDGHPPARSHGPGPPTEVIYNRGSRYLPTVGRARDPPPLASPPRRPGRTNSPVCALAGAAPGSAEQEAGC